MSDYVSKTAASLRNFRDVSYINDILYYFGKVERRSTANVSTVLCIGALFVV